MKKFAYARQKWWPPLTLFHLERISPKLFFFPQKIAFFDSTEPSAIRLLMPFLRTKFTGVQSSYTCKD